MKEIEKIDKYLDLARELKKLFRTVPKRQWTGGIKNSRKNQDHPNYSIVEISLNIEKSPGDLRRLAVTQIPVKGSRVKWANPENGVEPSPTPQCSSY